MLIRFKPADSIDAGDAADTEYIRALWRRIGGDYLEAVYATTGLRFIETSIVVRCGKYDPSLSGIQGREAMRISTRYRLEEEEEYAPDRKDDDALIDVLSHELCHRLLHEYNIVVPKDAPRRDYEVHRQLFVFLYDTWVAAFGEERAKRIAGNANYPAHPEFKYFYEAWEWARYLSKPVRTKLTAYLMKHKELPAVGNTDFVSLPIDSGLSFMESWTARQTDPRPTKSKGPWRKQYF